MNKTAPLASTNTPGPSRRTLRTGYLLALGCSLFVVGPAQARQPPVAHGGTLPIVYDNVTKGAGPPDRAAAKAYSGTFKIVEITTTQQNFQPGHLKGREMFFADFRSTRDWAIPAKVAILYVVTPEGRVTEPRVIESTDRTLTDGILAGMKFWRFAPARLQGQPVSHLRFFEQKFGRHARNETGFKGDGLGIMSNRTR